jgi:hypothetical protein
MDSKQIQQWAREAGATFDGSNWCLNIVFHEIEELQAFTTLVRNATLEECAENLDEWGNASSVAYIGSGAKTAATRIRSLKT